MKKNINFGTKDSNMEDLKEWLKKEIMIDMD